MIDKELLDRKIACVDERIASEIFNPEQHQIILQGIKDDLQKHLNEDYINLSEKYITKITKAISKIDHTIE